MTAKIAAPGTLIDEAVARLERHTSRDAEFEARFGKWVRPSFARRYPLDGWKHLIRYSSIDREVFELSAFIRALAPEDRYLAGEIARFVFEEFESKPATDATLNVFRLNYLRRLDACGF